MISIEDRVAQLLAASEAALLRLPRMLRGTAVASYRELRPLGQTCLFWAVAVKRRVFGQLDGEPPQLPPGFLSLAVLLLGLAPVACASVVPAEGVDRAIEQATLHQASASLVADSLGERGCDRYLWPGTDLRVTEMEVTAAEARLSIDVAEVPGVIVLEIECQVEGTWRRPASHLFGTFHPCTPSTLDARVRLPEVWTDRCRVRRLVLRTRDPIGRLASPRSLLRWESCR